jgi:hypothetical protein
MWICLHSVPLRQEKINPSSGLVFSEFLPLFSQSLKPKTCPCESRDPAGAGTSLAGEINVLTPPHPYHGNKDTSILEFWGDVLYFSWEMRLSKNQIEHMSFVIVRNLIKDEKIIVDSKTKLIDDVTNLITEEFQKEDKLDQEVREILSQHMEKIRKENIEYQTMFRMIKSKLAKERDIVL